MNPDKRILSDRELDDWERWAGRDIAWKPEDVHRLVQTAKHDRTAARSLESVIAVVTHGTPLYDRVVELRYKVLREPLGMAYTAEQLAAESNYVHLALLQAGEVVACLYFYVQAEGQVRVKQVAVRPDLQGKGLGRVVMEAAESLSARLGAREVVLNARQAAYEFYKHLGYEEYGEPFEEVGIPHRSMRKALK